MTEREKDGTKRKAEPLEIDEVYAEYYPDGKHVRRILFTALNERQDLVSVENGAIIKRVRLVPSAALRAPASEGEAVKEPTLGAVGDALRAAEKHFIGWRLAGEELDKTLLALSLGYRWLRHELDDPARITVATCSECQGEIDTCSRCATHPAPAREKRTETYPHDCGCETCGDHTHPAPATVTEAWQPIETVPKDGTRVLVSFGEAGVWQVAWVSPHWADDGEETWCVDDNKHGPYPLRGWGYQDGSCNPTHWMPLPALGGAR